MLIRWVLSERRPRRWLLAQVVTLSWICLYASSAAAGLIAWDSWNGVSSTSASNTVAYASGSVTATTNPLISVRACTCSPFATASDRYPNIDAIPYRVLVLEPAAAQTGSPYQIQFDFTGAMLNSGGVINVGGLFYTPSGGAATQFTIQAFGSDDVTPFPLTDLAFEQHAGTLEFAAGVAPLSWNPSTGLLTVATGPTGGNSQFGFFSPMSGEIGRIVFTASTLPIATNGDQVLFGVGHAVPEPALASLILVGAGVLCARRRVLGSQSRAV